METHAMRIFKQFLFYFLWKFFTPFYARKLVEVPFYFFMLFSSPFTPLFEETSFGGFGWKTPSHSLFYHPVFCPTKQRNHFFTRQFSFLNFPSSPIFTPTNKAMRLAQCGIVTSRGLREIARVKEVISIQRQYGDSY